MGFSKNRRFSDDGKQLQEIRESDWSCRGRNVGVNIILQLSSVEFRNSFRSASHTFETASRQCTDQLLLHFRSRSNGFHSANIQLILQLVGSQTGHRNLNCVCHFNKVGKPEPGTSMDPRLTWIGLGQVEAGPGRIAVTEERSHGCPSELSMPLLGHSATVRLRALEDSDSVLVDCL